MKAYVFPGQGSQFTGMGKLLYDSSSQAKELFEEANAILGFRLSDIMFTGSDEELKQTKVTQPAIFLHSVALTKCTPDIAPEMVAGHSLGEFSALVACGAMQWQDALQLVAKRANAMQKACELNSSTMAAILNLDDAVIEKICQEIDDVVVPANFNCPGQVVISGSKEGINKACEAMKAAGAKRAMVLPVGGAFHSPFMKPAKVELQAAIENAQIVTPICPIYQNVNAQAFTDAAQIKQNLIAQLTAPVRWTQSIQNMVAHGATSFTEIGPGKVLQGLIGKIHKEAVVSGIN